MTDDRAEIENLLAEYCSLFDQGDLEGYSQLFAHGRVTGADGTAREGADEVRRWHEKHTTSYPDGLPHTAHVVSNIRIEIADDRTTASSSCYVTVFQALPDFPLQAIFVGRYHDRFERHEGVWRWKERRALPDLIGDTSRHAPHLNRT